MQFIIPYKTMFSYKTLTFVNAVEAGNVWLEGAASLGREGPHADGPVSLLGHFLQGDWVVSHEHNLS